MKKNLAFSICMLALAVLTLCGVTFAYFSSMDGGGNQSVTLDNYEFDVDTTLKQTLSGTYFKAATIINFPQVDMPVFDSAAYEAMTAEEKAAYDKWYDGAVNAYRLRGDDSQFDKFCMPVLVTASSKSKAIMRFSVDVSAAASENATINMSSALRWYVFDPETTATLVDGASAAGKYAAAMRSACDPAASDPPATETDVETLTNQRLAEGRAASLNTIASKEYHFGSSTQFMVVCWLDYSQLRRVLYELFPSEMGGEHDNTVGSYRTFPLDITVAVTAENKPLEEVAP